MMMMMMMMMMMIMMLASLDSIPRRISSSDELKREETYRLAEDIDNSLHDMSDSLINTISLLNKTADRQLDTNNPLSQILKILNIHMDSIQWIQHVLPLQQQQ